MSDFVEGMNDDASMNYSRMDTVQCRAFLDSFFKLPEEERTKDEIVFKKASYAMGMLANNIINNEERENDAIAYEDRFLSNSELIALSKHPRTVDSTDADHFYKRKQADKDNRIYLFVRKNKVNIFR